MGQIVYGRFRREQPDLWRTASGWIWLLYVIGLVAGALLLSG
jgi:hypothetical protein